MFAHDVVVVFGRRLPAESLSLKFPTVLGTLAPEKQNFGACFIFAVRGGSLWKAGGDVVDSEN